MLPHREVNHASDNWTARAVSQAERLGGTARGQGYEPWPRALTDWGLYHVVVGPQDAVLDIGCGGGETVRRLAKFATGGTVIGIDHSADSVAVAWRKNAD